jgi:hypothetical protein
MGPAALRLAECVFFVESEVRVGLSAGGHVSCAKWVWLLCHTAAGVGGAPGILFFFFREKVSFDVKRAPWESAESVCRMAGLGVRRGTRRLFLRVSATAGV